MLDQLTPTMVSRASIIASAQRRLVRGAPELLTVRYGVVRPEDINSPGAQAAAVRDLRHLICAKPSIRAGLAPDDPAYDPESIILMADYG